MEILILGIVLLGAFFYTELRVNNPLIDFSIYRNRPFMIGNLSAFLNFVANFANTMLTPFYLQSVLNYTTSRVGLMIAIFSVCMAIVAPISGYASDKIGPVALTLAGCSLRLLDLLFY